MPFVFRKGKCDQTYWVNGEIILMSPASVDHVELTTRKNESPEIALRA